MELNLENGYTLHNPSADHIVGALCALPAGEGSFVILIREEHRFMQACGSWKEGFELEYQDGSIDKHFRCEKKLSLDDVSIAFRSFLYEDGRWRDAFIWKRLEL